jgi:hypothetical protein
MSHRQGTAEAGALAAGYDYQVRNDGKRDMVQETLVMPMKSTACHVSPTAR